ALQRGREGGGGELPSDHARSREEIAIAGLELVELSVDETAHVMRDRLYRTKRALGPVAPRELIDDPGHEQRIAAGAFKQQRRHVVRARSVRLVAEARREERLDRLQAERLERDL